jgi:hypothetical protein
MVMTPAELQKHIRLTYFSLRVGLGVLAFAFPVLLVLYGYFIEHIQFEKSLSAYYFAFAPENSPLRVFPMRVFFVGILWAFGWFLILYRGFSNTENWLLNFAGLSALAVAFFPMAASCKDCAGVDRSGLHYFFAVALFVLVACVALFCNGDSLRELENERKSRDLFTPTFFRWVYSLLGGLMILAPAAALVMTYYFKIYDWRILAVEWAGIWVFSCYWLVKSYELSLSRADEKAAKGEMTVTEPTERVRQVSENIRKGVSSKIASLRK